MFRFLILGIMRGGGAVHGYALMRAYREISGTKLSSTSFYRALQRLAAEGLVRAAVKGDAVDQRRSPYEITEAGAQAFEAWLHDRSVRRAVQPEDELSVRLLFSADAGLGTVNKLPDKWYEDLWLEGKRIERAEQRAFHAAEGTPRLFSALPDLLPGARNGSPPISTSSRSSASDSRRGWRHRKARSCRSSSTVRYRDAGSTPRRARQDAEA